MALGGLSDSGWAKFVARRQSTPACWVAPAAAAAAGWTVVPLGLDLGDATFELIPRRSKTRHVGVQTRKSGGTGEGEKSAGLWFRHESLVMCRAAFRTRDHTWACRRALPLYGPGAETSAHHLPFFLPPRCFCRLLALFSTTICTLAFFLVGAMARTAEAGCESGKTGELGQISRARPKNEAPTTSPP